MLIRDTARQVKDASIELMAAGTEKKKCALAAIAHALQENQEKIIEANKRDIKRSEKENVSGPLLKRLKFGVEKIADVIEGINSLIRLDDPVGKTLLSTELDDELELYKVTCPIGVIGVVFESRPDALVQISTLCLKSGNGVLLKGGSEALETNRVLSEIIIEASVGAGIPQNWMKLLESREDVNEMLKMDEYINLIIPRGSNEFVRYIMDHSRIPVMGHADGLCHCYVDDKADINMAIRVVIDSKTQYVAVCNALETLLVHEKIAPLFLLKLKEAMDEKGVELFGCPRTTKLVPIKHAVEQDWKTEYLDYQLSIKVVKDMNEAIDHINRYGSGHTETIVTMDKDNAEHFMNYVDAGNVFWNCSTRFSDGFRYGFGAEVGISTSKIHARGPVGLEGLLIYKYKLIGNGHIVEDYAKHSKSFKHKKMNKDFPF